MQEQAAKKVEEVLLGLALLQPSGRTPRKKQQAGAKKLPRAVGAVPQESPGRLPA